MNQENQLNEHAANNGVEDGVGRQEMNNLNMTPPARLSPPLRLRRMTSVEMRALASFMIQQGDLPPEHRLNELGLAADIAAAANQDLDENALREMTERSLAARLAILHEQVFAQRARFERARQPRYQLPAPPTDGFMLPPFEDDDSLSESEPVKVRCCVCLDDTKDPDSELVLLKCLHSYCKTCAAFIVDQAIAHEINYPPKCCWAISVDQVEKHLEPKIVQEFKDKEKEYLTPGVLRIYCSNRPCGTYITSKESEEAKGKSVSCKDCSTKTCTKCKDLFPDDSEHECQDNQLEPAGLAYSLHNRAKYCPSCTTAVQLVDACNHVTCAACRHSFCFICLQPWVKIHIPNHHPNCPAYGDPEYDDEGYDRIGYHRDTGFNREGYNLSGLKADGKNKYGGSNPIYHFNIDTPLW